MSASRRLHGRRGLKLLIVPVLFLGVLSPPSRAAWIEMMGDDSDDMIKRVAAFTGGVD